MSKIKIIICDDNDNIINEKEIFQYNLNIPNGLFSEIEGEVDEFKKRSSKEITQFLLEHFQKEFIREKKTLKISAKTVVIY